MKPVSTQWVSSAEVDPHRVGVAARVVVGLEHGHVVLGAQPVGAGQARHPCSDDRDPHDSAATSATPQATADPGQRQGARTSPAPAVDPRRGRPPRCRSRPRRWRRAARAGRRRRHDRGRDGARRPARCPGPRCRAGRSGSARREWSSGSQPEASLPGTAIRPTPNRPRPAAKARVSVAGRVHARIRRRLPRPISRSAVYRQTCQQWRSARSSRATPSRPRPAVEAWGSCIGRGTSRSIAWWRSRSSPPTWPKTTTSASASSASLGWRRASGTPT